MFYKRIASFIGLILLAGLLVYQVFHKDPITENNVAEIIKIDKAPAELSKDRDGLNHASKPVTEMDGKIRDAFYKKRIDSLTRALGISERKVQMMATFSGTATGTAPSRVDTVFLDTGKVKRVIYTVEDDYLSLRDTLPGDGRADYQVRERAHLTFFEKNKGFLGLRKDLYADIYSDNKNMKYTNLEATKVPQKKRKLKIALALVAGVAGGVLLAR